MDDPKRERPYHAFPTESDTILLPQQEEEKDSSLPIQLMRLPELGQ